LDQSGRPTATWYTASWESQVVVLTAAGAAPPVDFGYQGLGKRGQASQESLARGQDAEMIRFRRSGPEPRIPP